VLGQDHSESIVVGVAEAAGDAAVELDDAVHGFGAAVVGSAGGEVDQELALPGPEGPAEPRDLGDRAGRAYICSVERYALKRVNDEIEVGARWSTGAARW
jgi:hypothetical protein